MFGWLYNNILAREREKERDGEGEREACTARELRSDFIGGDLSK